MTSVAAARRVRVRHPGWPLATAAAAFLPFAALIATRLAESDTFWEVRTGLWILDHGRLPTRDPFSWTVAGRPWTLNSWGFDVLAAAVYRAGDLAAVAIGSGLLAVAALVAVVAIGRRRGASYPVSVALCCLAAAVLLPWFSARPQLVDYIAVPMTVAVLDRLRTADRILVPLVALAAVIVCWVNLHSAALLAIGICNATALLCAARADTRAQAPRMVVAGAVSVLATTLSPSGLTLLTHAAAVRTASTAVAEWQPISWEDPGRILLTVVGAAAIAVAIRRADPALAGGLAACLALALVASRAVPMLVLLAIPVAASLRLGTVAIARHPVVLRIGTAIGLAAIAAIAVARWPLIGVPDPARYPVAAVAALPAGDVATDYLQGGWVLLERPDVRVSLDSRNDLYGAALVDRLHRTMEGEGDLRIVDGADAALADRNGRLSHRLLEAGWTVRSEDARFVVLVPPITR